MTNTNNHRYFEFHSLFLDPFFLGIPNDSSEKQPRFERNTQNRKKKQIFPTFVCFVKI